jgi:hypothetical protein
MTLLPVELARDLLMRTACCIFGKFGVLKLEN